MHTLEDKAFLLLVVAVSLAFAWILWPLFGAVLWGTVIAILFAPLYRRLSNSMRQRRTLAALVTVTLIVVMVILPVTVIATSLLQEASSVYEMIRTGELNFGQYFSQVIDALPDWAFKLLDYVGLTNVGEVQVKLSAGLLKGSQIVGAQAIYIGQNAFEFFASLFVMLYLLFFLLRDGDKLFSRIRSAIPLRVDQQSALFGKFIIVIRATVKGNIVVALLQGALGGLIFWSMDIRAPVLWAVAMAFLSLLPAVGAAIVWLPVAIYFLATGPVWQGIMLIAYGVLVIGLVDNIPRPILVGKDTKLPDYVVLISTLGGMATFGLNGFVIGPVIAAMFMATWHIFSESRSSTQISHTDP